MFEALKIKLKNLVELTRAYALSVTFASLFVIFAYSFYNVNFTYLNFILLSIALCCVHLGANLFDDYIDVKMKLKEVGSLSEIKFYSYVPKARLILDGTYSLKQVERILNVLFSIAIGVGICFILFAGIVTIPFMILGALLTLFYPISSRYYLSEITIGLIYGPLMIMGGHYALCGNFSLNLFTMSLAIFFAVLVLLHSHNIMDWEFDVKENKNTLCVLSKTKENAITVLKWLIAFSYLMVVFGVLTLQFSPSVLYVFLTLPLAAKLVKSMRSYINVEDIKFEPRWYYGFFENWKTIKENKIEFFMYRFYLARNYTFFFALLASIGSVSGLF